MLECHEQTVDTELGRQRISQNRVLRGGSWNNDPQNLRSAYRNNNSPDNRNLNDNYGLRLAGALKAGVRYTRGSLNQLLDLLHLVGGQNQGPWQLSRYREVNPMAQRPPQGRSFIGCGLL